MYCMDLVLLFCLQLQREADGVHRAPERARWEGVPRGRRVQERGEDVGRGGDNHLRVLTCKKSSTECITRYRMFSR